jgi:hypothetical protein
MDYTPLCRYQTPLLFIGFWDQMLSAAASGLLKKSTALTRKQLNAGFY